MIVNNGKNGMRGGPCQCPNLPKAVMAPQKEGKVWTVKSKFFNPHPPTCYYKSSRVEMIEDFSITITMYIGEESSGDLIVIEIPELEFSGKYQRENLFELPFPGGLLEVGNWKNHSGVTLFHWWCTVRQKRVLIPNETYRNGGKSTWEIKKQKEREEIKKILKYH